MRSLARIALGAALSLEVVSFVGAPVADAATRRLDAYDFRLQEKTPPPRPAVLFRPGEALTGPDGRPPEAIVRDYLATAPLSEEGAPPYDAAPYAKSTSLQGDLHHIYLHTTFMGVPVFEGDISAHLDREGRLLRIQRGRLPAPPQHLAPQLTPRQAAELAVGLFAPDLTGPLAVLQSPTGPEQTSLFTHPGLRQRIPVSLVWFPVGGRARAAWLLYIEPGPQQAYQLILDADTGSVLFSHNLVREAEASGRVFPAPTTPHPEAGSPAIESFRGWPSTASGGCPVSIYPAGVSACWTDGVETSGNNIEACADLNGDDLCDSRAAGAQGSFAYPFNDSYNLGNDPAPDRDFALVNAFYWTNALHDWFYSLGFTEAAGNFQNDNFGRGGQAGDAVRVDIQDGSSNNQASFLTPPDGIAPRMNLGLYTGLRRDSALDGDMMTHEYAHGVTSRLIGGPSDASALYLLQSAALSEGWSDAFAFAFTGDPIIAEYSTHNPQTGIRTVRYDQSALTFGDFGARRATMLPIQNRLAGLPQPHVDGEIWASTLWDVRQAVGPTAFPALLIEALKMTPPRPSMLDARDAILQAASALGVGGADACAVWSAFAGRGMGASADLNPVADGEAPDAAVSVFEAFDPPAVCGGSPPSPAAILHAEDAESPSGWTATGLWSRSSLRAASGDYAWRFGRVSAGDYNTGQREFGELTSPIIDLAGTDDAILEWDQFLRTEGFWRRYFLGGSSGPYLNLDSARLWISVSGGSWRVLTHLAHPTPGEGFAHHRINLSRYAGQQIRLRFDFDTFTAADNAYEGLYLDNIRISAIGAAPPRLCVSPARIDLSGVGGRTIPSTSLSIRNTGGGRLEWTARVVSIADWVAVSPNSGQGDGSVTIEARSASAGFYQAILRIDAGAAGSVDVPLSLNVAEPTRLIAEWRLNEGEDGGGVAIVGSVPGYSAGPGGLSVEGVNGRARRFDGWAGGISMTAPIAMPDRFTARAWVRLSATPQKLAIVLSTFAGEEYRGWYLAVSPNRQAIFMAAAPPASAPWLVSKKTLQPERWHMLTATYDSASHQARLYVDGEFDNALTFPGLVHSAQTPPTIGKASWSESYFLPGAVDEVRIESGVRTASEIATDFEFFNRPLPRPRLPRRGLWSFEAAARGADSSGYGRQASALAGISTTGVSGSALSLNGSTDAVLIPGHDQLSPNDFTVAFWARLHRLPGPSGAALVSNLDSHAGWEAAVDAQGALEFTIAATPGAPRTFKSSQGLPVGAWKRIALAYRSWSRWAMLYVDGQLVSQHWLAQGFTPRANGSIAVGRAATASERFADFEIDELTILAHPWDAAQAASDFSAWSPPEPSTAEEPTPEPPAPHSLVARWELDETETGEGVTLADNVGQHHASTSAGLSRPFQGLDGAARYFGGWPDSASVPTRPELHANSFSFSTWIRIDETPAKWGAIYSTLDGASSGWMVGVHQDARIIFCVAGPPDSIPWLLSTDSLRLGRWHHVAVTFDGSSRRAAIYLDGRRTAGAVFPSWQPAPGVDPTIGRASWAATGYLKFGADRMRLYDYARSAAQTAAEFEQFADRRLPEPIARWEIDEDLADAGPNGLDGELTGSESVGGRFDDALRFRGAPDSGVFAPSPVWSAKTFSYSAWVKFDSLPDSWGTLFSTYDGDYRGWFVGVQHDGRVILCVAGRPSSSPWLLSAAAIPLGRWTQITVTFDAVSRQGSIFVDGSLEASAVFPVFTPSVDVSPTVGRASWTNSYYLPVAIDRMRLEPVALSVQEVLQRVME